jgi:hypothetical protein
VTRARNRIEGLALAIKRARRAAELAHDDLVRKPSEENRDAAVSANQTRILLESELRAACLDDMALISDIMRWADGR